jgi:DNA-binding transcriptional regulator YdaS (Cro superfamily)
MTDTELTPLERAIAICEGQTAMAKRLGVTQGTIWQWLNGRRPIPPARAAEIEFVCDGKVTARELLPNFKWPKVA